MEEGLNAAAIVEMLRRELDASKSVSDHLRFLNRVAAGEPMSDGMREHLVAHIGEEETEHQEHLARLIPAIESLVAGLGGTSESEESDSKKSKHASSSEPLAPKSKPEGAPYGGTGFTVGSLLGRRPWYASSPSSTGEG